MSRLEITAGPGLQLDRQRLVLYQLEKKGPREHVKNSGEIPASISLGRKSIKRDKPILESTDQGTYFGSVCTMCTLFPKKGELVHLFCFIQALPIEKLELEIGI